MMNTFRISIFLLLLGVMVTAFTPAFAACSNNFIEIKGENRSSRFKVEIADTPELRQKGLMFREYLATTHGMLFIFDTPDKVGFWMKNTPIPLDIIFINANGHIARIARQTEPYSLDLIEGGSDSIQYVLEINGNAAQQFGIREGDSTRHPRFNQELSVWPCKSRTGS